MQVRPFNIFDERQEASEPERVLSFDQFFAHLTKHCQDHAGRQEIFAFVLSRFHEAQQLHGPISEENISKFNKELYFVYNLLVPLLTDETDRLWGLAAPLSGNVFYGTDAFYRFLDKERDAGQVMDKMKAMNGTEVGRLLIYQLILERLYGFVDFGLDNLVYAFQDEATELPRYYALRLDNTFVHVTAKGQLPPINYQALRRKKMTEVRESDLENLLDLTSFRIEGFSIISLEDITHEHVVEKLKNIVIVGGDYDYHRYHQAIENNLKLLTGNPNLKIGISPVLKLNGRPLLHHQLAENSVLYQFIKGVAIDERLRKEWLGYLEDPYPVTYKVDAGLPLVSEPLAALAAQSGLDSLAVIPLFYNQEVVGLLEVYTERGSQISKHELPRLRVAIPLLSQFANDVCVDFKSKLDRIIKKRFTAIQPAVQWKFNEAAWRYLQTENGDGQAKLPLNSVEIRFNQVYPIYGAVDIRNSTLQRNDALLADLTWQMETLGIALLRLNAIQPLPYALMDKFSQLNSRLSNSQLDYSQVAISEFQHGEIRKAFDELKQADERLAEIILAYEYQMNPAVGVAHQHRYAFETAVKTINQEINQHLDAFNSKLQTIYPSYFEKFRTDGIEFDCYIGQSIAPHIPFQEAKLAAIKHVQLETMVAITRGTHQLVEILPIALETTQLIFINNAEIDISFREDERRFDVEGAYNIRYHIVKKRIDKALIKGTTERVTQPGKITLIYWHEESLHDYLRHIETLQQKGLLGKTLEYLELEELQGVSGLHALRIPVMLS
ncbi:hypothetical protein [Parapedobacter koreensis]|uniref:GAF domain-containing protein n=1 Tax=Parapedobacter koreensis TaxID=332977 RepID=A0A1H7F5T5_9SPHI|nr:hypothetical protein [Parapedobacter koreensis]SEK21466.1 hypothetical protein SAMN05421740_101237 [Parapedobacter koreensis]